MCTVSTLRVSELSSGSTVSIPYIVYSMYNVRYVKYERKNSDRNYTEEHMYIKVPPTIK